MKKNRIIKFVFILGVIFFVFSDSFGQNIITFQAGYIPDASHGNNICLSDDSTSITFIADTNAFSGQRIRHYQWLVGGVDQNHDSKSFTLNINNNVNFNLKLQLTKNGGAFIFAQTINFQVHHTPPTPVEINNNTQIIYQGSSVYNLITAFNNVNTSKYSYHFTGDHILWNGDFDKNAPVGDYHRFHYTVDDQGFCQIGDSLYQTLIRVVDDQASLPTFIKSFMPLPICGNYTGILLAALVNPACTTSTSPVISVTDGVRIDVLPVLLKSVDDYTGAIMYFFVFSPNLYSSNFVNITVQSTCPKAGHIADYTGKIPITPLQPPSILGFPSPESGYINLCSSLSDTIFMRGNPSGTLGMYAVERGHLLLPTDPGYTVPNDTIWTSMNDSVIKYKASYVPPSNDPTLMKFTPSGLFNYIKDKPEDVVRITYFSPPPCGSYNSLTIKFIPPVAVSFNKPADTVCYGKPVKFNVIGNAIGTPDQYFWSFGDETTFGYSSDTVVYHNYSNPGMYIVRFKTLINNLNSSFCNNDIIDTIWVGAQPKADFEVMKNFLNTTAIFKSKASILVNNSLPAYDTIFNWQYVFEPGVSISQSTSGSSHTYTSYNKDPFQVLHIVTSRWGCKDTAVKFIPVFPIRVPTPANSSMDAFSFSDITGWYESGQYKNSDSTSSWQNRTPQASTEHLITAYPSGGDAWITGKNADPNSGYYNNESSWVESPVFDLSQLKLPMVSMNTWANFDNLFDGAALQYTFCDTAAFGKEKWYTLGEIKNLSELGKGLNWYNSNSIIAKPGGTLSGWTNDTLKNWLLSAYRLSGVLDSINAHPSQKLVRFRVITGTNNDNTPGKSFDGFAFDNFFVGERNRKVIIEEFCDYLPNHFIPGIDTIFKDPQALRIQYHVRTLTTSDDINNQNRAEPSARALLYGVGAGLPRGVIDGIIEDNNHDFLTWGEDAFFRRSLMVAPFNIGVTHSSSDKLYITASIKRVIVNTLPKNYVVQVAILEKEVSGNGKIFTNVLRNLVPNSTGNRIDASFAWPNDSTSISVSWSPFQTPQSDLRVIVFIQDEDTKEIYQANYDSVPYTQANLLPVLRISGLSNQPVSFNEVSLYPNPTSGDLNILFNGMLKETYNWKIIDAIGTEFNVGKFLYHTYIGTINTLNIPEGIYYLKIEGEGQEVIKKFSIMR